MGLQSSGFERVFASGSASGSQPVDEGTGINAFRAGVFAGSNGSGTTEIAPPPRLSAVRSSSAVDARFQPVSTEPQQFKGFKAPGTDQTSTVDFAESPLRALDRTYASRHAARQINPDDVSNFRNSPVYKQFFSNDVHCRLEASVDGDHKRVEQTAPDHYRRILETWSNGPVAEQETVKDPLGRTIYQRSKNENGTWSVAENSYALNANGRPSPWKESSTVYDSSTGKTTVFKYNAGRQISAEQTDLQTRQA